MITEFADSSRPGLIPSGSAAMLYADGRFRAPPGEARRFAAVRWITVTGGPGCGAADYERYNPVFEAPERLAEWAKGRRMNGWRARCYTSRDNLPGAWLLIGHLPNVRWWIATLDGEQRTAAQLADEISQQHEIRIDPDLIWAQQWKGGPSAPYDESVLLGVW